MADLTYPFDPTGTNPLNRITNEVHVITPTNNRYFNFAVAEKGPFFEDNVQLVFRYPDNSVWNMVHGVDYYFGHKFLSASKACAKELYGSIVFLNNQVTGILTISYNTIGGTWIATPQQVAEILADLTHNPRITTWENIQGLPYQFPVVDHEWDLVDMVGMSEVVTALDNLYGVLVPSSGEGIAAHIDNLNNPHQTTKTHVGLSNVQNYPMANIGQAQAGALSTVYMSSLNVRQAMDSYVPTLLAAHNDRQDNPHNTTKAQVQLGNVDNFATATKLQAEAGTDASLFMTALRVKQAFTVFASPYDTHVATTGNPHGTTKDQIGLNLVENYGIATLQQAQAGVLDTVYMTASKVAAAVSIQALVPLNSHTSNNLNPHGTTKDQISLGLVENYGIATKEQAESGAVNNVYMTPLRVKEAIAVLADAAVGGHLSNFENPHNTTAEHVGLGNVQNYGIATQLEAEAGASGTVYMTAQRTSQAFNVFAQSLTTHVSTTGNPHGMTKSHLGLNNVENYLIASQSEAEAGLLDTVYMTALRVKQAFTWFAQPLTDHIGDMNNPHQVTAGGIGAYTTTEVDLLLNDLLPKTSTAADTLLVTGLDPEELFEEYGPSTAIRPATHTSGTDYVWYKLAVCSVNNDESGHEDDEDYNRYRAAQFLFAGGSTSGGMASTATEFRAPQLVYLNLNRTGLDFETISLSAINLVPDLDAGGVADPDLEFGYTYDSGTDEQTLYVRINKVHPGFTMTRLDGLVLSIDVAYHGDAEPSGIQYTSIQKGVVASNSTKWAGAAKTVSTSAPSGGDDGDVWFEVET